MAQEKLNSYEIRIQPDITQINISAEDPTITAL
jgi:hypothetical protein